MELRVLLHVHFSLSFDLQLVFVCYDVMVEIRQRSVLSRATDASGLVASLFPKAVRDRLYEEAKEKRETEKSRNALAFKQGISGNRDITAMMETGDLSMENRDIKSKPIADLCK